MLVFIACASAPVEKSGTATAGEMVAGTCFNVRETRGFHALHDRYVYVKCLRERVDRADDRNGESPSER